MCSQQYLTTKIICHSLLTLHPHLQHILISLLTSELASNLYWFWSKTREQGLEDCLLTLTAGGSLAQNHSSSHFSTCALGCDLFVSRDWFPWQQQLARACTFPPLQWRNAAGKENEGSLGPQSLKELFCNYDVSFSELNCHHDCI